MFFLLGFTHSSKRFETFIRSKLHILYSYIAYSKLHIGEYIQWELLRPVVHVLVQRGSKRGFTYVLPKYVYFLFNWWIQNDRAVLYIYAPYKFEGQVGI